MKILQKALILKIDMKPGRKLAFDIQNEFKYILPSIVQHASISFP
jgi:hypothetical protein